MIHSCLKSPQKVQNFRSFSLLKTTSNKTTSFQFYAKKPTANVAIVYSFGSIPFKRNFHGSIYDQTSEQNTLSSHNINISNPATMTRTNTSSSTTDAPSSVRTKLRVADVLKTADHQKKFSLPSEATIADAMAHLVKQKLSSSLIIDKQDGSIAGIFTARDLLKSICDHSSTFHPPAPTTTPPNPTNTTQPSTTPAPSPPPTTTQPPPAKLSDAFPHTEFSQQVIDFMNKTKITDIMTKREKLVYCSPSDSLSHCREIMFQCKIRNLPIIDSNNVVRGILTMKTIADSSFNLIDIGGKKGFIHNVTGRRGLPNTAKVELSSSSPSNDHDNGNHLMNKLFNQLDLEIGAFALPHPFKSERGAANNRRDYGAFQLSTDLKYCEDAYFAIRLKELQPTNPLDVTSSSSSPSSSSSLTVENNSSGNNTGSNNNNNLHQVDRSQFHLPLSIVQEPSQVFLAVADGVGSWRQYGIDPREYSHKLIENARKVIENDHIHRAILGQMPFDRDVPSIHPLDIILDAWNITTGEGVQGSSTICVATLDKKLNQLSYSNIGDCGLIVLRHIDSETAGYMRDRSLPRHERKTDLKIAYISQQQLRSFNLPYQLGYSKLAESPQVFETPNDADTASIPVMPGDIIILATDGLYDNIELNEIIEEVYKWEKEYFNNITDEDLRYPNKKGNNEAVQNLAERLVKLARELSLDTHRDSPFAILAKENDIMWGGGMPDDTTVVVGRVVAVN